MSNFNRGIERDARLKNLSVSLCSRIPIMVTSTTAPLAIGCIVYDPLTQSMFISNGIQWISVSGDIFTLPPSLASIASLTTTGDEILYTIASNIYAISDISSIGRNFLSQTTIPNQQSVLALIPGTNIQTQNNLLQSFANQSGVVSVDQLFYTTGSTTVSPTSITPFGRSLVAAANATGANTLLGTLTGSISTTNRVVRVSGANTLSEATNVSMDVSDNITGVNDLTIVGTLIAPTANITTFNNQFSMGVNKITSLATPTLSADAATKQYVDNSVAGAGSTFGPAQLTTTALLTVASESGTGVGKTLTGTVGNMGTVDGVAISVGDRILVKNNTSINGASSNGIYDVTDDGSSPGPSVVYTRSTDADQSAELVNGKTVVVILGTTLGGTQWITASATSPPTVDTNPITFVQVNSFTGGTGIDITGNVISTDATVARDTNSLTLTNKTATSSTNNITARSIFSNSGANTVSAFAAANPTNGQVLTATSATTATWQGIPSATSSERLVIVSQSGGDYTSIQGALVDINAGTITGGVPIAGNEVTILVSPGTYNETNPIIVPSYVTIRGQGRLTSATVTPATSVANNIFQMSPFSACYYITAEGATGAAGFFYNSATSSVARIEQCLSNNCDIGFFSQGAAAQFTSIMVLRNTAVTNTTNATPSFGYQITGGGVIDSVVSVASGFSGGGFLTACYECSGSQTLGVYADANGNFALRGYRCENGGAAPNECEMRVYAGELSFIVTTGIALGLNAIMRLNSIFIQDNTALFANQQHVITISNPPPNQSLLQGANLILRSDLITIGVNTKIEGAILSTTPGEAKNQFLGEISVGFPGKGAESVFGEGDSHVFGLTVCQYTGATSTTDGTFSTDITSLVLPGGVGSNVFDSGALNDVVYIGFDDTTGTGSIFGGLKWTNTGASISPSGGKSGSTHYIAIEYFSSAAGNWRGFGLLTPGNTGEPGRVMSTDANIPYDDHADEILSGITVTNTTGAYQYRFGTNSTNTGNDWTQHTLNGLSAFWMRFRVLILLVTNPNVSAIKIHTNRTEINSDGFMEYFGTSRPIRKLPLNWGIYTAESSGPRDRTISTGNTTVATVNFEAVRFSSNGQNISTITEIPTEMDTSWDPRLQFRWFTDTGSASITWTITYGYTEDFLLNPGDTSNISQGGSLPNPTIRQQVVSATSPGTANKQTTTTFLLEHLQDMRTTSNLTTGVTPSQIENDPGSDLLWIIIEKTSGVSNVYGIASSLLYRAWCNGEFINE